MTRPIRLEFPGALYHITSRGDRKEPIFVDDSDRMAWLAILADVCLRFHFVVHSYCQMGNHYHLLLETADANLAQGMRQLNGVYSQYFNRKYQLVGHLFQGRYQAILVQKGNYLLELSRYVVLNPLRAGLVASLDDWRWSSHSYVLAEASPPDWLRTAWVLAQFSSSRIDALAAYRQFLLDGIGKQSPLKGSRSRLIAGDDDFRCQLQAPSASALRGANKAQRSEFALPLTWYEATYSERDEAITRAYRSAVFSMGQIARHFNVSTKTVARAIQRETEAQTGVRSKKRTRPGP